MLFTCTGFSSLQRRPVAMITTASRALRSFNSRATAGVANCLLVKQLPSSVDYTSSSAVLRERRDESRFTERRSDPNHLSSANFPHLDVRAGGGSRQRTPRVWKTKVRKGSVAKSEKLLDVVRRLSNVKEEVYGALDAWIAWDLEFPLIAVKKALKTLRDQKDYRRVIQISKWMLEKGQGKTLGTYTLLLEAFDAEGRIEEAEILWNKILTENLDCVPRTMYALMISMFDRYGKLKEVLKVFAEMEELEVKADSPTLARVVKAYRHYGYEEHAKSLSEKYPTIDVEFVYHKGKRFKVKPSKQDGVDTSELKEEESPDDMKKEDQYLDSTKNGEQGLDGTRNEILSSGGDLDDMLSVEGLKERPSRLTANNVEEKVA